jgi:N-methylhydantoinase A/oxoprolinase/acetone carboxylase beta subunit
MTIALGIDTGGTYTDAVLVDQDRSRLQRDSLRRDSLVDQRRSRLQRDGLQRDSDGVVLATSKVLTTRHDLSVGIGQAVAEVLAASAQGGHGVSPAEIGLVGLSTTLATNAIVEGQGSPVCLLLVGYDPTLIEEYGFGLDLVTRDVVYLGGGHDVEGNEVAPLDEAAAREAILARRGRVEAFAVSGYFGVRNPAHELRVRALVEELTASTGGDAVTGRGGAPTPVTCGHELTTRLHAVRRATTAALNARLIPLLRELVVTVRRTLDDAGIVAPLMIVKGDGSLVRAEWAMRRPIETILSGPAASVVGAWHLAGRRDVWVVDVGGTTTDIAVLRGGQPRMNPEGARVGRWRTMVEAVDVYTVGLGGDSHVRLNGSPSLNADQVSIGPRRVVPLCLLASEHPGVVDELRRQVASARSQRWPAQFVFAQRRASSALSEEERYLLRQLDGGPRSLRALAEETEYGSLLVRQIEGLESRRLVLRSGFTPTDALHVLGRFERWDVAAARLGAELLAAQEGLSPQAFCERVVCGVSNQVTTALVSKVLSDEVTSPDWEREPSAAALLARAVMDTSDSDLECRLTLRQPLVAVGAPVEAYLPLTARQLSTELVVPPHAEVANAIGAVASGVVQRLRVLIRPVGYEQSFRLHLPGQLRLPDSLHFPGGLPLSDGVCDFATLDEAVAFAGQVFPDRLTALARQAGAEQVEVGMVRVDRVAPVRERPGEEVYLETELTFTAAGRPSLVRGRTS